MLPDVCIVDDVYRPPVVPLQPSLQTPTPSAPAALRPISDADETIPKRRSFGDEYLLSCRQSNTVRRLAQLDLLPGHVTQPLPVSGDARNV